MKQKQNTNASGAEGELFIGFVLVVAIFVMFWYSGHVFLSRLVLKSVYLLNYVPAWSLAKIGMTGSWFMGLEREIVADSWRASSMTPVSLFWIAQKGSLILLPLAGLPLLWARVADKHPVRFLNRMHGYADLMEIQSRTNPCIVPVVRFTQYWAQEGIARHDNLFRALAPDEYALKHNLIDKSNNGNDYWEMSYERSTRIFEAQIGGLLDVGKLPDYKKALGVIFMTRIVYRGETGRETGRKLLDEISKSCDPAKAYARNDKKPDFSAAFDFSCAKDFDTLFNHEAIREARRYFVHETTFFMHLLARAREDGKLTPSDFIWLKLIDRKFWYVLYGVSRTLIAKGYVEGAGPFGQYWAAKKAMESGQVLVRHYTEETLRAFERRLFEANMVSERKLMTERERKREAEFGRIPEI